MGFILTLRGKRRMVLRTDGGEVQLKVAKALRKELSESLEAGARVLVQGTEEREAFSGNLKRTVLEARVLSASGNPISACAECPIRVCAKKNCWKGGGKEVYEALCRELEEAGLAGEVEVKKVGCLDNCKRGPNLLYRKRLHERCTPAHAAAIVAKIIARRGQSVS